MPLFNSTILDKLNKQLSLNKQAITTTESELRLNHINIKHNQW